MKIAVPTPEQRMSAPLVRRPEERGIHLPIPFGWYVVAYTDEIAPGEVKPLRYFGQDLVLWRGADDGRPRLLDAYCRHLGAHMGYGGKVHGNALECPFHGWRYDQNGAVQEIPYAQRIPTKAQQPCVGSWPVVERNRQIWAWYHPRKEQPLWEVTDLPETCDSTWSDYERYEWIINAHLQDMAENNADPAHFLFVHGTKTKPDTELNFEGQWMTGVLRAKMQTPRGVVDGKITTASHGPGQSWVRFSGICETMLVTALTPVERDVVHARFAYIQPLEQINGPSAGLAAAMIRDLTHQVDQDKPVWDRKIFWQQPLLCDGDGPIAKFRKYYSQYYCDPA